MATRVAPEDVSNERLIRVINTGQPGPAGLSKMRALSALRHRQSTDKAEVFSSVLANPQELPRYKHIAIMGLYELSGQRAQEALVEGIHHVDQHNAATVAQALGRIGSADTMPIIAELIVNASDASKQRAAFAASLLAYRHNLDGHEVQVPSDNLLMSLAADSETLEMEIRKANGEETQKALAALTQEPVDVSLTVEDAQQIVCGPNTFLFIWNREVVNQQLEKLRERKAVVGLLLRRNRFQDIGQPYALSGFVLGTPLGEKAALSIHHTNGESMYAGALDFNDTGAELDLRTVERPGAIAIQFSGAVREGRLEIGVAQSSAVVHRRLIPRRAPVFT